MGQAAGTAAHLSLAGNSGCGDIAVDRLQDLLAADGVYLGRDVHVSGSRMETLMRKPVRWRFCCSAPRCSARRTSPPKSWPPKTVHIIVPFGAGSTPDTVARLIADQLGKKYPGSAFVVENKPGASGNLGTDAVAKAKPDGSTIGISIGGPLAINTLLFSKLPYDPKKDIAAITQLITQPSALAVALARGRQRRRAGQAAEGQSGQIQFRFHRQRLAVASGDGGDGARVRHQDRARAL